MTYGPNIYKYKLHQGDQLGGVELLLHTLVYGTSLASRPFEEELHQFFFYLMMHNFHMMQNHHLVENHHMM